MSKTSQVEPTYLADNPWKDILSQRGKDSGQPASVAPKKPLVPETGTNQASVSSGRNRGLRLLQAALQAYELHLQHFTQQEIAATLGVSARQVHNYIRKARAYLGVPEGLKHAALAEVMLAIKLAWRQFYTTQDPRVKVLWYQAALRAMIHRDRLLGLLDGTVLTEEIKH